MTGEDKFLTIRVPADDHKALAELAKRNERTIAAEVRLAIRAALETERTTT